MNIPDFKDPQTRQFYGINPKSTFAAPIQLRQDAAMVIETLPNGEAVEWLITSLAGGDPMFWQSPPLNKQEGPVFEDLKRAALQALLSPANQGESQIHLFTLDSFSHVFPVVCRDTTLDEDALTGPFSSVFLVFVDFLLALGYDVRKHYSTANPSATAMIAAPVSIP